MQENSLLFFPDADIQSVTTIFEHISEAVVLIDANWNLSYVNLSASLAPSVSREDMMGENIFKIFPAIVNTPFEETYRRVMRTREAETVEANYPVHSTWNRVNVFPLQTGGIGLVIQEKPADKRMKLIAESQSNAMGLALAGASLEDVLDMLVLTVEKNAGHKVYASILLVSDNQQFLQHGAAPSLPDYYCKAIDGIEIEDNLGACGTTAYRGQYTATEDIATDPRWALFADLAIKAGLHACWSIPIFSTENKSVLGTFAVYYPQPQKPIEADRKIVEVLSRTAAIVIEKEKEARARKQAEQALLQGTESLNKQRRLYEAAISNTPDFIYVFNLEGRFTYVNDALLESWGRTWEEAIGKTCLELGYEQWHADMHMRELEQVIKTKEPIRGDVPFTGPNGTRMYDYIFVPVIGDNGEVEAIAGTTRDVTKRREAEEAARKAEERQRLALEASHGFGIWEWDIKSNILTADERLGCLFGLTPEEAREGVPIEKVLQSVHEEDIDRVRQSMTEKIRDGGQYSEEYRIRQSDGSIRWGSFKGRIIRDENGEALNFPGVGVDVTGEKNAILALQEADRKKDEFLATLAHELRNPLAPIRNALHILKSQSASHLHQKRAHELIERQVTQMVRLVDDLMDVSRITRGKINLSTSVFNIEEALIAAIETIQPLIDERQHQLTVNSAEEPVFVHGDLVRLSQVFANILNNAAKYTGINGSITVEVTTTQDAVNIAIADDGAGIPADMLPNIFDMFSQVDDSLEHAQGGLGIGLTLVQQLVALHDGEIRATSDGLGKGSCFTVNLPRCSAPAETAEHNPASEPDDKASLLPVNVLIVDDNQDAAVTMAWILEAMDYRVEVAEDATEALQMVEQFTPDLALLDIGLPGMNGYDLCVALKKNPALAHTMFVAQTGWGQPEHIERSKACGFSYHLVKPVNMSEIKPLLEEVKQILAQQPKH